MPFVVHVRKGGPSGKIVANMGTYKTQAAAKKRADALSYGIGMDEVLTIEEGTARKSNPMVRRSAKGATNTVMFGGKRYTLEKATRTKASADKLVKQLRADGYSARSKKFRDEGEMDAYGVYRRGRAKKAPRGNPAEKGTGCRDAQGAFIPIPRCGVGKKSTTPTKTLKVKVKGKADPVTYTLDSTARDKHSAMDKAGKLRAQGYSARFKAFPQGYGVYRRGRKAATKQSKSTKRTTRTTAKTPRKKAARAKRKAKTRANPKAHRMYKGHAISGSSGDYTVEPYGWKTKTLKEAKRLLDRHVAQTMRRPNPRELVVTETETGGTTRGWISREGKLGGPGYTSKSASTRRRLLTRSVNAYGYKSTLGSLQALLRGRMSTTKKAKIRSDKNWLVRTYGG